MTIYDGYIMDDEYMHVVEDYASVDLDDLRESVKDDELFEILEECVLKSRNIVENFEKIRANFVAREEVLDDNGDCIQDSPEHVIMDKCDESFFNLKGRDMYDTNIDEANDMLGNLESIQFSTSELDAYYLARREQED
ncbi:MAG: hypothetical protein II846_02095 [Acetobacter sp.]|nr:hypothetical protein [Acetobacter sp.]